MFTCFYRFTFVLLAFVVLFAACGEDDNPIIDDGHDHEDEPFHADADGFVLKVDGNQIYRQFEGEHEGSITLKVGEELEVAAAFLDHDGDEFLPENPEEEDEHDHDHGEEEVFALALSAFDSSIIKIHLHEGIAACSFSSFSLSALLVRFCSQIWRISCAAVAICCKPVIWNLPPT